MGGIRIINSAPGIPDLCRSLLSSNPTLDSKSQRQLPKSKSVSKKAAKKRKMDTSQAAIKKTKAAKSKTRKIADDSSDEEEECYLASQVLNSQSNEIE
eukprot:4580446-Pleurochrysis_carterae.AAC.1